MHTTQSEYYERVLSTKPRKIEILRNAKQNAQEWQNTLNEQDAWGKVLAYFVQHGTTEGCKYFKPESDSKARDRYILQCLNGRRKGNILRKVQKKATNVRNKVTEFYSVLPEQSSLF